MCNIETRFPHHKMKILGTREWDHGDDCGNCPGVNDPKVRIALVSTCPEGVMRGFKQSKIWGGGYMETRATVFSSSR